MKIALINENSQATKNSIIYNTLVKVAEKYGHEVYNYGMEEASDKNITYVGAGLLSAILLNSKAVDFVITGCGTGQGAMLACNAFPNVNCGLIVDPTDAILFAKINDGNAVSIPFAKGYGWAAELNLEQIFENLFKTDFGSGYPSERVVPERQNKKILDIVKEQTHKSLIEILPNIDNNLILSVVNNEYFKENYFKNSQNPEIDKVINSILINTVEK